MDFFPKNHAGTNRIFNSKMTKIVGLTGGIGSGKSTVLKMFEARGVAVYIADIEAKRLMNEHPQLKEEIITLLGEQAYKDGELNRAWIAKKVFNDAQKLTQLNNLVHPKVKENFLSFVEKSSDDIVLYEAAILFESGTDSLCDFVITVVADEEERIQRVMRRDGVTKEQVLKRIRKQLSDKEKIQKSDFVIYNNDLALTEKRVEEILTIIKNTSVQAD